MFHRDNEEGGDGWRAERGREEVAEGTSGGETMRHGGLFEDKIAEASQGNWKKRRGGGQVVGAEERFGANTDK